MFAETDHRNAISVFRKKLEMMTIDVENVKLGYNL